MLTCPHTHNTTFSNTICRSGSSILNINQLPSWQQTVCYWKREWHTKKGRSTNPMVSISHKKWHVLFFQRKMKTSAVAFLPHEPQESVKTSPEKLLEARADPRHLFWGPATFPSCLLDTDIRQEMCGSCLPARGPPCHVSAPQGRTGLWPLRECVQRGLRHSQDNQVLKKNVQEIPECRNT